MISSLLTLTMIRTLVLLIFSPTVFSFPSPEKSSYLLKCSKGECTLEGEIHFDKSLLVEGDIIQDEVNIMETRNAVIRSTRKWPNAEVPYVFHEYFTRPSNVENKKKLIKAMRSIEEVTCIKFKLVADEKAENYVAFTPAKAECSSKIGYLSFRKETVIRLGTACFNKLGTLQHELMHALGVRHQHSRPDRDEWVTIVEKNINKADMINFAKSSPDEYTTFGLEYNYDSVMHYPSWAFSVNGGDTIIPKKKNVSPRRMGQRDYMTKLDVELLNKLYEC